MDLLLYQIYTFVIMFIFGTCLGLGFDIYRKLVRNLKCRSLILNLSDLFFGLLAGTVGFFVLLYTNWGEFRFYIICAVFLGLMVYFYLIRVIKFTK